MTDRKLRKNTRELISLRHRSNPHVYDKKVAERKRRLLDRIRRLKTTVPEIGAE